MLKKVFYRCIPLLLIIAVTGCGGGGSESSGGGGSNDGSAPTNAAVTINNGDGSTSSTYVTLTLSATDDEGVTGYYASESPIAPEPSAFGWAAVTRTPSYAGIAAFTLSSTPGVKTVYTWFKDGDGMVSASGSDTITLTSSQVPGLAGTWGYQIIRHDPVNGWYVELSEAVFNGDGTGSITGYWNNNGTLGSGANDFTYAAFENADGSFTMATNIAGDVNAARWVLSDDGNMIVTDGTEMFGSTAQGLMSLVKLDGTTVFTNADFAGLYYTIGYGYKTTEASYRATSTLTTADGAGSLDVHGTRNNNGVIGDGPAMVTYDVLGAKVNLSSGTALYISGNGNIAAVADTFNDYDYEGGFFMKQESGYSTFSIEGTWAIAGFGDDNGTSYVAEFGTMTCAAAGACTLSLKNQADGVVSSASSSMNIAVAADGSFGASLSQDAPPYAGAIGNGGNTLMFNVSFDSASPNHREIFLGVKCSTCSDLSGF
ncbi:MAG: hypothetical protein HY956_04010 [Deltaproteobacteria bacterium]|nr:hypothetical protein [Deltaproteobacteria bacterium]